MTPWPTGKAVRALMRQAREQGGRLIQFPEGAICGYVSEPLAAGPEMVRRQLELTARLAWELGLWVVAGTVHNLTPPHWPHNNLYVTSDRGRLAGRYDKRTSSYTELTSRYSPEFELLVVEAGGFRFGCVLCIEVSSRRSSPATATAVSSASCSPRSPKTRFFEVIARERAAAYTSWVSISVPAQYSTAMPVAVIGPHGYPLARCPAGGTPAWLSPT